MKNILYIVFPVLVVVGLSGCDTAGGADDDIFARGADAALASWVSAPSGDLILSDPTSALAWEVEFIDESNGSTVESFQIAISDGTNSGSISYSSFTANAEGNQGVSGSISLNDIASAIGVTVASMSEDDDFTFAPTLTRGGVVYPVGNASQFLNAVADFSATIATETTSLTTSSVKNESINSADTLFLEFTNDFTTELLVDPTLTIVSATGQVDNAFGAVAALVDEDGDDSVYYAILTPTAAATDTISVTLSAASAIATGFAMVDTTLADIWIVDNAIPTATDNSSFVIGSGGGNVGYGYNIALDENIGDATLTVDITGVDDDGDGDIDGADADGDAVSVTIADGSIDDDVFNFTYTIASGTNGTLTLTLEDLAGNAIAAPIVTAF